MSEACKQCECEHCDCECHDHDYVTLKPGHRLWEKKKEIQQFSNGIIDLALDTDLTNMEAIEALSLIMVSLVSYEIKERPNDKKEIMHTYEQLLNKRLFGIALKSCLYAGSNNCLCNLVTKSTSSLRILGDRPRYYMRVMSFLFSYDVF